ncbi:MAG: phage terminase large subunit [Candidatus Brocadiales bacterium]
MAKKKSKNKWTKKQMKFMQMLADPLLEKKEEEDIATELKVKPETLTKWRRLPGFQRKVKKLAEEYLGNGWPAVLKGLSIKAKGGNVQAIKMFMDYAEHHAEKLQKESNDEEFDIEALTKEERMDLLVRLKARDDIALFAKRYLSHYLTAEPAPFHLELYKEMEDSEKVCNKRFVCAAPRGHGKSVLVSLIYPLWCICTNRKRFIVIISSSSNIAEGFLGSIIRELENNDLLQQDFGDLVGSEKWTSKEILTRSNVRACAKGSNSTLRGMRSFEARPDLIICDDLEDEDVVNTQEQREKLEAWFNKSVLNLQGTSGDVFVIGTVLHYDSLLSKLLKRWKGKRYQAIAQDETVLWPTYYTKEMLDKIKYGDGEKAGIGSVAFESEYQNNPVNPEDQIIKGEWIKYYKLEDIEGQELLIYSGLDPSVGRKSTSDYSAIVTIGKCNGKIYVLDCDMHRRSVRATAEAALRCYSKWSSYPNSQYVSMAIETNAFQVVLKQMIDDTAKEQGVFIPTLEIRNMSDKVARLSSISPLIESGIISFLFEQHELIEQLIHFPKAAHDDGPDALEMAIRILRKRKSPRVRTL